MEMDTSNTETRDREIWNGEYPKDVEARLIKRSALGRRKILIVESDSELAEKTRDLIEKYANARCEVVSDTYEAFQALCENNYDYVVIDQNIGGFRGVDALVKFDSYLDRDPLLSQQRRFSSKIPVLLMTATKSNRPLGRPKMAHFEIMDRISKEELGYGLARTFAS